ncbi:DUF2946 domain-containing protein [Marinomonas sp. A79]|uniref:DUF2946 domain-containing protein n=1 Tax=Marinomonas vulgaris TaxID=2823372 RepID=A0ABS5H8X5_9GAMM|nr:DUF2946 domain-containing protein [Marinomonas vulgaris]MBR7887887.1 DUF2946 domain-containing protein [Marinomonas vulgaris]
MRLITHTTTTRIGYICLFAILLLAFGPLIAQIRAPSMSPLLMHTMPSMNTVTSEHKLHDGARMEAHSSHHSGMAMDHSGMNHKAWDEQCGYCDLSHNFPFIHNSVPIPSGSSPLPPPMLASWVRSAFDTDTLFVLALKRAPPSFSTPMY